MINRKLPLVTTTILVLILGACNSGQSGSPFINAEPDTNSIQTTAPRTLRLYYQALPDVPRSTVTIEGPNGDLTIRGLHTMGANDLMMEIYDEVPDGYYTVKWKTFVGDDPTEYQGQYNFTVQAN